MSAATTPCSFPAHLTAALASALDVLPRPDGRDSPGAPEPTETILPEPYGVACAAAEARPVLALFRTVSPAEARRFLVDVADAAREVARDAPWIGIEAICLTAARCTVDLAGSMAWNARAMLRGLARGCAGVLRAGEVPESAMAFFRAMALVMFSAARWNPQPEMGCECGALCHHGGHAAAFAGGDS